MLTPDSDLQDCAAELELPNLAVLALRKVGIYRLSQLMALSPVQLAELHGIGAGTRYHQIQAALERARDLLPAPPTPSTKVPWFRRWWS